MTEVPWFRRTDDPLPFRLSKKISSQAPNVPDYSTASCFPWDKKSLQTLWEGSLNNDSQIEPWNAMISKYWDAVAVGADHRAYIIFTHTKRAPIRINMPKEPPEKLIDADKVYVAWALGHRAPCEPLLIVSRGSLLYIYSPERAGMAGYLRGHGNAITSIAVHPTRPHIFCTTSRDTSARIYDLTLAPTEHPNNPHWPPDTRPSLAGAAHGLHMNEQEGSGLGRCIIVLMGGRSGGHQAAVLGAAFHPHHPIIATCGMDRCVKIWAIRPITSEQITREDKPLFSSSRIHKARVLSVSWLQEDILLTHSAPSVLRVDPYDEFNKNTYLEPGEMVVWRWLGLNRFFPPDQQDVHQTVLRGIASDYQESSSFTFIAVYALSAVTDQYITHHLHLSHTPNRDPLAFTTLSGTQHARGAIPSAGSSFLVTNIAMLQPRKMPTFAEMLPEFIRTDELMNFDEDELTAATQNMHIGDRDTFSDVDRNAGATRTPSGSGQEPRTDPVLPVFQPEPLPGRLVKLPLAESAPSTRLLCTAVTCDGRFVIGIGTHSMIWVWRVEDE